MNFALLLPKQNSRQCFIFHPARIRMQKHELAFIGMSLMRYVMEFLLRYSQIYTKILYLPFCVGVACDGSTSTVVTAWVVGA